jgi:FtsZ-binding cell division protein ZapB
MEPETTTSEQALEDFDSLLELENRIQGIADRFGEVRRVQQAAEQDAARLGSRVSELENTVARLQAEVRELRAERRQVRERIEALLGRIDSL